MVVVRDNLLYGKNKCFDDLLENSLICLGNIFKSKSDISIQLPFCAVVGVKIAPCFIVLGLKI